MRPGSGPVSTVNRLRFLGRLPAEMGDAPLCCTVGEIGCLRWLIARHDVARTPSRSRRRSEHDLTGRRWSDKFIP